MPADDSLADAPTDVPRRARGEIDLRALRAQDPGGLLDAVDRAVVWSITMATRFRGIGHRDGVLLHGPAGWGEVAPFWDHGSEACATWLASALESALTGIADLPRRRTSIPVNVTIPEVDPVTARDLVARSGAGTAKVKIAGAGRRGDGADATSGLAADLQRLEAVREAIGPRGRIRVDVNGAWDLTTATTILPLIDKAAGGLAYAEQPCPGVDDLAALRRAVDVPIAADESIRLSADPLAVARSDAADVAVLKVAPLGGARRAFALAERLAMPVVVSSALDTSVGMSAGVALAAALPGPAGACGLGTVSLLERDVAAPSLVPGGGTLAVRPVHVSRRLLAAVVADDELTARWQVRLGHILNALRTRRERERDDPSSAVAGLPL